MRLKGRGVPSDLLSTCLLNELPSLLVSCEHDPANGQCVFVSLLVAG